VIPTSTHVVLHYGFTPVDNAGRLASVGGLVAAGTLWWMEQRGGDGQDGSDVPDGPAEAVLDDSDRIWGGGDLGRPTSAGRPVPAGGPGPAPPDGATNPPAPAWGPPGPPGAPDGGGGEPVARDGAGGANGTGDGDHVVPPRADGPWSGPWIDGPGSGSRVE